MNLSDLTLELEQALAEVPILDIHTHLIGGKLGARGLHDVLLYHMAVSDLYGAGCPTGKRLTEYPKFPSDEEAHARIQEALPYLAKVQNTSTSWGIRILLNDLYNWTEPITEDNWRRLDATIRERADDRSWHHSILDRLNIKRTGTEIARRGNGEDDERFQYALEWGFFTRCQWKEFDTALHELESCWGNSPLSSPSPIGAGGRAPTKHTIHTVDDLREAVHYYVSNIPYDKVLATATHISTDIRFQEVSDSEFANALSRRREAGPVQRDIYASYLNHAFLTELEKHGHEIVLQFSFAAEPLPFETASRVSQESIAQIAAIIGRHPKLRFQCFLANVAANQSMCTLARELPNFSLAGYWWHNFFPDAIRYVMSERLDMLPLNKQVGFFSDAYAVEWTYAKVVMVRRIMAQVLARRVEQRQYSREDALNIARAILYESPQTLLGMKPRN